MHKTLVFVIFPLHSSVFHHRTERFVKFDAVLHHDLESFTINGFRDSMSCHVTWNLHWLMENQRGYMGVHERSDPSLNEGYMEKQRGYMRGT